ncbi:MAG TPA: hypothetical protein VFR87_08495 [Nocardioidaceae bacterium]|nr:hypothetical protein [Nocardioidaceae bacterium]
MITFDQDGGVHVGIGLNGRSWRITEVRTGWHLEFRDEGDRTSTNAGVHRTLQAAIAEADRQPSAGGRRR